MGFDIVLALYQRCSFRLTGQCEGLNTWNGQRTGSTLFLYSQTNPLLYYTRLNDRNDNYEQIRAYSHYGIV